MCWVIFPRSLVNWALWLGLLLVRLGCALRKSAWCVASVNTGLLALGVTEVADEMVFFTPS